MRFAFLVIALVSTTALAAVTIPPKGTRVEYEPEEFAPEAYSYTACETLLSAEASQEVLSSINPEERLAEPNWLMQASEKVWKLLRMNPRQRDSDWWHVEFANENGQTIFRIVRGTGTVAYEKPIGPNFYIGAIDDEFVRKWQGQSTYAILEERDGVRLVIESNHWESPSEYHLSIDVPCDQINDYLRHNPMVGSIYPIIETVDKTYCRFGVIQLQPGSEEQQLGRPWWIQRKPKFYPSARMRLLMEIF